MANKQSTKIFVNVPVKDLKRSMDFFNALGFEFNPKFTDENAACMVFSEDGYAMLLTEPFFANFTKNGICNTATHSEALVAFSCNNREDVNAILQKAIAAGGRQAMDPVDHGFMYSCSFYDLDGHHWEPLWMDPKMAEA